MFVTNPCPQKHYKTTRAAFNALLEDLKGRITSILDVQIPASECLKQVALLLVRFHQCLLSTRCVLRKLTSSGLQKSYNVRL